MTSPLLPKLAYSRTADGSFISLRSKRFRAGKEQRTKNESQRPREKWREWKSGEGVGKKGRKRLQTNPGILKTAHLACYAWVRAPTFDAVISCHNWPIKCLAFSGAEMNFRGRVCEPKIYFFVFCNPWTAFMLKYQWIRTINTGFGHLSFFKLPSERIQHPSKKH